MRALILNAGKSISVENIPKPVGDTVIKVLYSAINPSDLSFMSNVYGRVRHKSYPLGIGFEGSGIVKESINKDLVGKKVSFTNSYDRANFVGAWSDYTVVDKGQFILLPDNYSDMRKAACLFINPLTAFSFIDIMKKNNFKAAIHTAGLSAVGKMFTRLCVKNNFKVINTVRRENYLSEMKELGSSFTISTSNDSYKKELLLAKEEFKPEVAFDSIGGEMTGHILNALNDDGVLYHYGNLSSRNISNVLTYDILFANKSIQGFWLINYLKKANVNNSIIESFTETLKDDASLYDSNIQAVYKPENFEEAFKTYKENMTKGKILFDFTN